MSAKLALYIAINALPLMTMTAALPAPLINSRSPRANAEINAIQDSTMTSLTFVIHAIKIVNNVMEEQMIIVHLVR